MFEKCKTRANNLHSDTSQTFVCVCVFFGIRTLGSCRSHSSRVQCIWALHFLLLHRINQSWRILSDGLPLRRTKVLRELWSDTHRCTPGDPSCSRSSALPRYRSLTLPADKKTQATLVELMDKLYINCILHWRNYVYISNLLFFCPQLLLLMCPYILLLLINNTIIIQCK